MPGKRTLYLHPLSGHSHRVAFALSLLGLEHDTVTVDIPAGAQRQPEFLKLNPFGQVPVLDDGGTVIADSNAILSYLAATYDDGTLMPRDPVGAAQVQRWFSVTAGELARGPGAARLINVFKAPLDKASAEKMAATILTLIESHLAGREWLVADRLTFADVAVYGYVRRAPEGGIDLAPYPTITAWLSRVEAHPRFVRFIEAHEFAA